MAASGENITTDAAITAKPVPPASTNTTTTTPPKPNTNTKTTTDPPIKIETKPGASIYSKPLMLTTYDKYVLGFSMTYLWRCPSSTILVPLFRQNFRPEKHLDIVVGTGFFGGDALAQTLAKDKDLMPQERELDSRKFDITLMD